MNRFGSQPGPAEGEVKHGDVRVELFAARHEHGHGQQQGEAPGKQESAELTADAAWRVHQWLDRAGGGMLRVVARFQRVTPDREAGEHSACRFAHSADFSASKTIRPPIRVRRTRAFSMAVGGMEKMSSLRITRSASLPGVRLPLMVSVNSARAEPSV